MTSSNDCPQGRSQLFTLAAEETITVDRVTLEQLLALLNSCAKELAFATTNSIFPESLKTYLSELKGSKADKALALLSPWIDTVPEALEEITEDLGKARRTIEFILAARAGVSND